MLSLFQTRRLIALGSTFYLAFSAATPDPFDPSSYSPDNVIERDVAVIGGGASGTYAAINLRDMGRTVVLVEKTGRLGGQAKTYQDSATSGYVDYGVQVYHNDLVSSNFFKRLRTPVVTGAFPNAPPIFADFTTGALVPNYTITPPGNDYLQELAKYPNVENGVFLPRNVPRDLLLSTADYIKKFNLQDSAITIFNRPAIPGSLLDIPMLYVFNDLNHVVLDEIAGNALVNANHDNSQLYINALAELGKDVLLSSTVTSAQRGKTTAAGVRLVVKTPSGNKLIQAKQLVLGIPVLPDNISPFNPDTKESAAISQLFAQPYYGGVVKNTGLNFSASYHNQGVNTQYHLPTLPGITTFNPATVKDHFYYWFSSLKPLSQSQVEGEVSAEIKRLQTSLKTPTNPNPAFVAYADFTPFHPRASAKSISDGVYSDLYALQGYRNTWYVSALFVVGSSQVWNETASYLPQIAKLASGKR